MLLGFCDTKEAYIGLVAVDNAGVEAL